MSVEGIPMVRCPDWDVAGVHHAGPGAFCWVFQKPDGARRSLYVFLPSGHVARWPIHPLTTSKGHSWEWDGDEDAPTLTPSLHLLSERPDTGERKTLWHGWVTRGRLHG